MQSKDSSRAVEEKSLKTFFETYTPWLTSQFMKVYIKNSKFVFILNVSTKAELKQLSRKSKEVSQRKIRMQHQG